MAAEAHVELTFQLLEALSDLFVGWNTYPEKGFLVALCRR
jgi:hypothetical protein